MSCPRRRMPLPSVAVSTRRERGRWTCNCWLPRQVPLIIHASSSARTFKPLGASTDPVCAPGHRTSRRWTRTSALIGFPVSRRMLRPSPVSRRAVFQVPPGPGRVVSQSMPRLMNRPRGLLVTALRATSTIARASSELGREPACFGGFWVATSYEVAEGFFGADHRAGGQGFFGGAGVDLVGDDAVLIFVNFGQKPEPELGELGFVEAAFEDAVLNADAEVFADPDRKRVRE